MGWRHWSWWLEEETRSCLAVNRSNLFSNPGKNVDVILPHAAALPHSLFHQEPLSLSLALIPTHLDILFAQPQMSSSLAAPILFRGGCFPGSSYFCHFCSSQKACCVSSSQAEVPAVLLLEAPPQFHPCLLFQGQLPLYAERLPLSL